MEKYSDVLRRLAQRLDDDFKGNIRDVVDELFYTLRSLVKII